MVTIVVVVVAGIAFYGGMRYQQLQKSNNGFYISHGNGTGQVRRFGNGNGTNTGIVRGQILSADNGSLTVKLPDGSSKLVLVNNNTRIEEATAASQQDLTNGKTVAVFGATNSDGSVTAQNIQLNPGQGFVGHGG